MRPPDASRQTKVSRTKRPAGSASASLLAALLLAAVPAAHGQNATPAAGQSANPSSPAPSSGDANKGAQAGAADTQVAGGTPAAGATQAADGPTQADGAPQATGGAASGTRQPSGSGKSGKPPAVCFQLTGRCVEGSKPPAAKSGTASASKDGSSAQARPPALNLTAPDVRTVVSADELKEPLPSNEQVTEVQEADTVSVKGEGIPTDVPVGFGAIWWALNHPSQAWRIVTPYE